MLSKLEPQHVMCCWINHLVFPSRELKIKLEERGLILSALHCTSLTGAATYSFNGCRELKIKLEEDRKRLVEAINTTFGNLVSLVQLPVQNSGTACL